MLVASMTRAGRFFLILICWWFLSLSLILGVLITAPTFSRNLGLSLLVANSSKNIFNSVEVYASDKSRPTEIYAGRNSGAYFDSWSEAINIVATRMRENYSSNGIINPETIVIKYTSQHNPAWVFAVQSAIQEISATEY